MAINNVTRVIKKTSTPKLVHRFDSAIGAKYISTFKGVNTEFVHFYYNRRSNPLNVYRYISINKEHAQTLLTETHPTYGSHDERKISLNFPSGLNNNIILQYGTVTDFLFDDETYISYQDENKIVYGTSLIRAGAYGARIASTFFGYMIIKSINTDYTQFEVCGFIPLAVGEATDTPNAALLKFNNNWYFFGRKRGSINSAGNKDWGKSPYNETTESTFDETTIWQDRRGIKLRKASSLNGTWNIVNPGTGGVLDYANTSTGTPDKYDPLYYTNSNASETPSNQLANEFILNNICENYYGVSGFKIDNTFLLLMDSFFQNRLRIVPTENDNGGAVYDPFKGTGEEYPTLWLWKSNDYAYRVKDDNGDYTKTIAPDGEDTNTVNDLEVGLNTNTIPGFKRKWYSPIVYEQEQLNNNEAYYTIPEFGQLKISSIVDAGNIYLVYWAHRLDTHYREILRYSNESQHEGKYTTKEIDLLGQTRSHPASNSGSLSESYTYANNMRTAVATAGFLNNRFQKPTFAYVTEIPKNRFASWKKNNVNLSAHVDTKTLTIPANADYIEINHIGNITVSIIQSDVIVDTIGPATGDNIGFQLSIPSAYKGQSVKLRFNLINNDSELFAFNFARIKPVSTGFQLKTPTNGATVPNAWTVFKWDAVAGETPETVYTVGITGDTNTNSPNDRVRTRSSISPGNYTTVLTSTNPTATAPSHSITIVEAVVSVNKDQITFYRSEGVSNYKVQFSTTAFPSNVNDPFTSPLNNSGGLDSNAEITFTYQADIDGLYPSGSITESLTSLTFPSGTIYCRMRSFVPGDDVEQRAYVSTTYRNFTVAQSAIEAPTLLNPSNGGTITTSGSLQFTHVTSTPNVTSYGIQFSTSSNFNADKILVVSPDQYEYNRTTGGGRLVGNTMTVPVDSMGTIINNYLNQFIYWRVRVRVVDGITLDESQTTWSQSRQIRISG